MVLQGGGALGAFQAGVYEALEQTHYLPNWIAGTSIGAINGKYQPSGLLSLPPPKVAVPKLKTGTLNPECPSCLYSIAFIFSCT